MLEQLTKKGKKVLVAVDEAAPNTHVREFTSQFQTYMRKGHAIFLLMAGLYENVYELQNKSTLTFLYRAPKIEMGPLNARLVARQYQRTFDIPEEEPVAMSRLVRGYPYAYQVLGYLCYKRGAPYSDMLDEFDAYLAEYVYEKIRSELSENDRTVVRAMAAADSDKVEAHLKGIRVVGVFRVGLHLQLLAGLQLVEDERPP